MRETTVFNRNRLSDAPIVINRGGGGSSKSHSLARLLCLKALAYPDIKILIIRKTRASLKKSVCLLLDQKIIPTIEKDTCRRFDKNKTDLIYSVNGSPRIFLDGVDDPKKLKSTDWNIIWFEEATDFTLDDYRTVKMYCRGQTVGGRPNQIFLSFNPVDEFSWIKTHLIDTNTEYEEIHSTYLDNPFLPEQSQENYENLVNEDKNYYRIYTLGKWGQLSGLIYHNWETVTNIPTPDEIIYGLDFGFNNQSALAKISIYDKIPYIEEKIYRTELTNLQLMKVMVDVGVNRTDTIYADCAEPARIKEMSESWEYEGKKYPGFNVHPAIKSVWDGIDFVKRYRLMITPESTNLLKEIRAYKWKEDRQGRTLEEPVKLSDHLIDSIRYGLYTHLYKKDDDLDYKNIDIPLMEQDNTWGVF